MTSTASTRSATSSGSGSWASSPITSERTGRMRTTIKLVPLALVAGAVAVQACNNTAVPDDSIAGNQLTPAGVIQGNVVYNGPPPCTQNGQVVGNAIILVFDRRNPPPPA